MKPYEEVWGLSTKISTYRAVAYTPEQANILALLGHTEFRAMSVGGPGGQVAIIPLDESSEERGRLAASAPEMARMLLKVWNDDALHEDLEMLLVKVGVL